MELKTVIQECLVVECGTLELIAKKPERYGGVVSSLDCVVKIDGKEVPVRSITIRAAVGEAVNVSLEFSPGFEWKLIHGQ